MIQELFQLLQSVRGLNRSPVTSSAAYASTDGSAGGTFTLQASAASNSQIRLRSAYLGLLNTNASMPLVGRLQSSDGTVLGHAFTIGGGQANAFLDFSRDPIALGQNKGFGLNLFAYSSASLAARLTAFYSTETVA